MDFCFSILNEVELFQKCGLHLIKTLLALVFCSGDRCIFFLNCIGLEYFSKLNLSDNVSTIHYKLKTCII